MFRVVAKVTVRVGVVVVEVRVRDWVSCRCGGG